MKRQLILSFALLAALWGTPHRAAAQIFAVRANALAALTATLDLGAEVSIADKWTVEASGYWNPLRTENLSTCFHAVQLGGRYWLYESFVDLGSRTRRYDGLAFGIGLSYGYSWMLSTRWNVAVEAGIGLFRTRDTRRDPTVGDWDDEYIYHYRRWTLFPSRLGVSFSYLF